VARFLARSAAAAIVLWLVPLVAESARAAIFGGQGSPLFMPAVTIVGAVSGSTVVLLLGGWRSPVRIAVIAVLSGLFTCVIFSVLGLGIAVILTNLASIETAMFYQVVIAGLIAVPMLPALLSGVALTAVTGGVSRFAPPERTDPVVSGPHI